MEDGVELAARPRTRDEAGAFHRRLAAEDVLQVEALRAVDIHRIADADDLAVVGRQAACDGQRRKAQIAGDADQREVVAARDLDDAAIDRLAPAIGHDADAHVLVAQHVAHDMGVGDHHVRRNGKAGAVADREEFLVVDANDYDAHHAACGGVDVGRVGLRERRREQGQEGCESGENTSHRCAFWPPNALTARRGMRACEDLRTHACIEL